MQQKANRAFEKAVEGGTIDKLGEARIVGRGEDEHIAKLPMNINQNEYQEFRGEEIRGQGLLMSRPKNIWYNEAILNAVERCEALDCTLHAGPARKVHHGR